MVQTVKRTGFHAVAQEASGWVALTSDLKLKALSLFRVEPSVTYRLEKSII